MVEFDRVNDHKIGQVVFVRNVIAVPSDDIERTVLLDGLEEMAAVLVDDFVLDVNVFEPGRRCFEIPRIGQSVCTCLLIQGYSSWHVEIQSNYTDGPQIRECEMSVVNLENVAAGRTVNFDAESHPFWKSLFNTS